MLSILSSQAIADPKVTPDQVIESCAKALNARDKQAALCNLALQDSKKTIADQNTQIETLSKEKDVWFRDWRTTGAIGLLVGIIVTGYAIKK